MKESTKSQYVMLLFVFGMLSAVAAWSSYRFYQVQKHLVIKNDEISKLQVKVKDTSILREKLALCLDNGALATFEGEDNYSYELFGVYSPLFESQKVESINYEYKNNVITGRSVKLKDENGTKWGVDEWNLSAEYGNLSSIQNVPAYAGKTDFPLFIGYENYMNTPTFISEMFRDWSTENLYTSKTKEKMYLSYNYAPKSIGSVQYEFYNPVAKNGKGLFVIIWREVENYPLVSLVNEPEVLEAVAELKKVADKISFRVF